MHCNIPLFCKVPYCQFKPSKLNQTPPHSDATMLNKDPDMPTTVPQDYIADVSFPPAHAASRILKEQSSDAKKLRQCNFL